MSKNNISYLTAFQKEEYTRYLQCQLQKFSAFILSQKKENQKYRLFQSTISKQNQVISELQDKIRIMSKFQTETIKQQQKIKISTVKIQNFQNRINKLQAQCLSSFNFNDENKTVRPCKKQKFSQKPSEDLDLVNQQQIEQIQTQIYAQITEIYNSLSNKIKQLEKKLTKNTNNEEISAFNLQSTVKSAVQSPFNTNYTQFDNFPINKECQSVSKKDLKKVQKKLKKMIEENFINIFKKLEIQGKRNVAHEKSINTSRIQNKNPLATFKNVNKQNNDSKLEISSYQVNNVSRSKSPKNSAQAFRSEPQPSSNSFRFHNAKNSQKLKAEHQVIGIYKKKSKKSKLNHKSSLSRSVSKNEGSFSKSKRSKSKNNKQNNKNEKNKSRSASKSISNVSDISKSSKISKRPLDKKHKNQLIHKHSNNKHKSKYDNLDSVKEYLKICKLKH